MLTWKRKLFSVYHSLKQVHDYDQISVSAIVRGHRKENKPEMLKVHLLLHLPESMKEFNWSPYINFIYAVWLRLSTQRWENTMCIFAELEDIMPCVWRGNDTQFYQVGRSWLATIITLYSTTLHHYMHVVIVPPPPLSRFQHAYNHITIQKCWVRTGTHQGRN